MNVAAIIIGIDGWEKYTLPLIESLQKHEPSCDIIAVDNLSESHYPPSRAGVIMIRPTHRLCYSAAINRAHDVLCEDYGGDTLIVTRPYDWYIVLSNDVLCEGPFMHILEKQDGEAVIGPLMKQVHGFDYIEGWAVFIPRKIWDAVGGWDEEYQGSDYEDVDLSTTAREKGFWLEEVKGLPFKHLDQRQRYHIIPDFAGKNAHNQALFLRKHAKVTA